MKLRIVLLYPTDDHPVEFRIQKKILFWWFYVTETQYAEDSDVGHEVILSFKFSSDARAWILKQEPRHVEIVDTFVL